MFEKGFIFYFCISVMQHHHSSVVSFQTVTWFLKLSFFASLLLFIMLNSCPLLSFCPAPLTIPLQGLWVHSLQSSTIVPFHCMHMPFFKF